MADFKLQGIKKDENGNITHGYCTLEKSVRKKTESGSIVRKETTENLGDVIFLENNNRCGIFYSDLRGLFYCDCREQPPIFTNVDENDPRIEHYKGCKKPKTHAPFGDMYFILQFLKNVGFLQLIKILFPEKREYEKVLIHILHALCKDGINQTCEEYFDNSFLPYLMSDIISSYLVSDTNYFENLGDDDVKVKFFKEFIKFGKTISPDFGNACYVDSTPLPDEIKNCYLKYRCSHGVAACSDQVRMVLVLDKKTNFPIWFDLYCGNILDLSTIVGIVNDIDSTLNIKINEYTLDAGYVSQESLNYFMDESKDVIMTARCPNKKGYRLKDLFFTIKNHINDPKYIIRRKNHTYFAKKVTWKIFEVERNAYVFIDKENAADGFASYYDNNIDEYNKLTQKEQSWKMFNSGYFVLLSNQDVDPSKVLDLYFERTNIENIFKIMKQNLGLLPLCKHSLKTIYGKILSDTIVLIAYQLLEKEYVIKQETLPRFINKSKAVRATVNRDNRLFVETLNKQISSLYKSYNLKVPNDGNLADLINDFITNPKKPEKEEISKKQKM